MYFLNPPPGKNFDIQKILTSIISKELFCFPHHHEQLKLITGILLFKCAPRYEAFATNIREMSACLLYASPKYIQTELQGC